MSERAKITLRVCESDVRMKMGGAERIDTVKIIEMTDAEIDAAIGWQSQGGTE